MDSRQSDEFKFLSAWLVNACFICFYKSRGEAALFSVETDNIPSSSRSQEREYAAYLKTNDHGVSNGQDVLPM